MTKQGLTSLQEEEECHSDRTRRLVTVKHGISLTTEGLSFIVDNGEVVNRAVSENWRERSCGS